MRKRWMTGILVMFFLCAPVRADAEISVDARAAILIERESGRVLYEKNADTRYPMASTTKIMTALIAVEHCRMDEIVTAGPNASGVPGTSIYLGKGEQLTMYQMLQGLMLRSGNDAAVAIAEHIAGDVKSFAALMNARASMLGADAYFVTPNGLDEGGHSASARAMALITRAAMENETFRELVGTQEAVIPWVDNEYSRVLRNKNRLLREYEGATGVKTGFTSAAGRCLVFSAERDGMELIGVVLNCPDWFGEAERLLDWGFANFSMVTAAEAGEKVAEANILNGEYQAISLCAEKTVRYPVCAEDEWSVQTEAEERLEAPVTEGQAAGHTALIVDGEEIAGTDLIARRSVRRMGLFSRFIRWLRTLPFFGKN
ncbi:MAG: D-alanyl-D-alanine carboxypeptidase [Clostridia bacterium]|nr:D-alanyl-D-alanine carboxypeptidase [Clostridia bacterium]